MDEVEVAFGAIGVGDTVRVITTIEGIVIQKELDSMLLDNNTRIYNDAGSERQIFKGPSSNRPRKPFSYWIDESTNSVSQLMPNGTYVTILGPDPESAPEMWRPFEQWEIELMMQK